MNYFAVGFCAVAAVAVAGVDYYTQATSGGRSMSEYAVSEYLQSYGLRLDEYREEKAKAKRQSELAKVHLPEAPEGWERVEWVPEAQPVDGKVRDDMGADEQAAVAAMQNSLVGQMAMKESLKQARKSAKNEVWEYVRGDTRIRLRAVFNNPVDQETVSYDTMAQIALNNMMAVTTQLEGYAVVQGVPFFKVTDAWGDMEDVSPQDSDTNLVAQIGSDIELSVKSNADPEELLKLLDAIDYDALNLMLDTPLDYVGSNAPELSREQQFVFAARAAEAHRAMQFTDSRELQAILANGLGATAQVAGVQQSYLELLEEHGRLSPYEAQKLAEIRAAEAAGIPLAKDKDATEHRTAMTQDTAAAKQPAGKSSGEKPRRLQLQSQTNSGSKRCVGSFCD